MNKRSMFRSGFSLVELVVVMAIFGVLFTVVSNTFINSLKAANKAEATKEVRQNGEVILARMSYDLKQARSITSCPSPTRVNFVDMNGVASSYQVSTAAPVNQLLRVSGATDRITDWQKVQIGLNAGGVSSMVLTCTPATGRVDISFELEYLPFGDASLLVNARSEDQVRIPFRTTIVNRNVD